MVDLLVSFYDHILIYYPNIFFSVIFLLFFLCFIFFIKLLSHVSRKSLVKQFKKIRFKRKRLKFTNTPFKRKRLKFTNTPLVLIAEFLKGINNIIAYFQSKIEKVLTKIEKEIFIDE